MFPEWSALSQNDGAFGLKEYGGSCECLAENERSNYEDCSDRR